MFLEIEPLNNFNFEVYLSCGRHPEDHPISQSQRERMERKRSWVRDMSSKGLGARIAFLQNYPAGFAEFMPIEVAPAPVIGKHLLFLTDIHVNREDRNEEINLEHLGVGKMLIRAVEQYAREKGFWGLATFANDGAWMPESFYESIGFELLEKNGELCLLWLPFRDCPVPTIWNGNFKPTVRSDGVHVDVIRTSQCPGIGTLEMWQEVAGEYGSQVSISEHNADDRSLMDIDCSTGCMGVFVNGKRAPCRPISSDQIRKIISESLLQIPIVDST